MLKINKIIAIIIIIILSLITIATIVFYRPDLSVEELEDDYFTMHSNYCDITVSDLSGVPVNITIHYQDNKVSSDNVVVLLHGMFASSHTFEYYFKELTKQSYRVILIDLPNHGLSGNYSDNTISQRRSAAVVRELLNQLDIESCIIGGNSMGGGVSWYFASEYHNNDFEVKGLILIDSVYPLTNETSSGGKGLIRFMANNPLSKIISKMTPRFMLKGILKQVYGSKSELDDATVDRYYHLLRKQGNRQAIINTIHEEDDSLGGIERLMLIKDSDIAVLVMWGEEDSWIDVEYAYMFKDALELNDERIIIYEGRGHVPMEEAPELTYQDVSRFINEVYS